jgi:hypothetical protein
MMKSNLLFPAMMVVATSAFAQPTNSIVVAIAEPSSISLIAAGVIALGLARRKATKP